jgi:hypothetical protein
MTATSVVLEALLRDAPPDHVTIAWLVTRLHKRSFGLVMLLIALVSLVPGPSAFLGILLAFPALQMILGQESPSLPRFIALRRIPTPKIARLVRRAIPLLRRLETIIHPRWHMPFDATKRGSARSSFCWPQPSFCRFRCHIIPALVIMLVSFAYLEEDGVLLCMSLAAALASFAITAATVWATVRATGLLEKLLWEM